MICESLDVKALTTLCCVSRSFQRLVQPMNLISPACGNSHTIPWPILHLITNLRSLFLPIHTATAKLLDIQALGNLGRNLKVKTAYETIFRLGKIIIALYQFKCGQLCSYYRPDELQLQRMDIGSCELDHRSTIKLLRGMRSLAVV